MARSSKPILPGIDTLPNLINQCAVASEDAVAPQTPTRAHERVLQPSLPPIDNQVRPPLTPDNGGRSIGTSALRTGDIIVSTTEQVTSAAIRAATNSPVSHTAMYVGDGMVVEAIGSGVVNRGLDDALADDTLAVVLRAPDLSLEQALRLRDYVGRQLDKPYAYLTLFRAGGFQVVESLCSKFSEPEHMACLWAVWPLWFERREPNTFFCSQLVIDAYAAIGLPLVDQAGSETTPGVVAELTLSGTLKYVGHLLYPPPRRAR